jgi:hypothetical protein
MMLLSNRPGGDANPARCFNLGGISARLQGDGRMG